MSPSRVVPRALLVAAMSLAAGLVPHSRGSLPVTPARDQLAQAYLALPLAFERNEGQAPPAVAYLARGIGHALALTREEAVLSVARTPQSWTAFRLHFEGANPNPEIRGTGEMPGRSHHLNGRDRSQWRTDVPNYARVTYRRLYPGIDLVFRGSGRNLEYDFVLAPGATPDSIRLRVGGADSLAVDAAGDLHLRSGALDLIHFAPHTHQERADGRVEIPCRFVLLADREIGFAVAAYDHTQPLVIDPVLRYASYLGGSDNDGLVGESIGRHIGVSVDASGSAILVGETQSTDFPAIAAEQPSSGGGLDAFVIKLLPNGRGLVYSTYLGGSDDDSAHAIAVDASGNAVVVGATRSSDFPTLAAFQPAIRGASDAFVVKLSPAGTLLFSTFLGGAADDAAAAVAIDGAGNVHVTGATRSTDFPVRDALQPSPGGGSDGFVARITPSGALAYASYLGGAGEDAAESIAVGSGAVLVAGNTRSPDFPTLAPVQGVLHGASDAFVTRLTASGAALLDSTYLGGSGDESAHAVIALPNGVAVVAGDTSSIDFPTAHPLQPASGGDDDAFLAGIAPNGAGLAFSTYLGGSGDDTANGVVAASGALFAIGTTDSRDFPIAAPMQAANAGVEDAWLARLAPGGGALAFSTYLGGESADVGLALTASASGRLFLAGYTNSRLFPTYAALKSDLGVGSDAFLSAIDPIAPAFAYSTFLGGSSEEASSLPGARIAVDGAGHAYVTGPTLSPGLATDGVLQTLPGGASDVLIAKLATHGSALDYLTYLGGTGDDAGLGIAVDDGGHAYVTGRTNSPDFPVVAAWQPEIAGGSDAFVAKLAPNGDGLLYSTYLGGSGADIARGIAVDAAGGVALAGTTNSRDFPVRKALQPARAGGLDAFVSRLSPSGALDWSTYLGGSRDENPSNTTWGIALDPAGNVYVAGTTESPDFPLVHPIQSSVVPGRNAYIGKIAANGGPLLFSTYLGGSGGDTARDIAVDSLGRIYVVGATRSPEFPVVNAIEPVHHDPLWYDAFVARIGPGLAGPVLDFSTFLGGSLFDGALAVAVDPAGNIHVAGYTSSPDFPIVRGSGAASAADDAFLTVLSGSGDRIGYSTRLGGTGNDIALGVATDGAANAYLVGIAASVDLPTVTPFQPAPGGASDLLVAKVALGPGAFACDVATDRASYGVGQWVQVTRLRFANAGLLPLPARLHIDLAVPVVGSVDLLRTHVILPANLDADPSPLRLFLVDSAKPHGTWTLGCTLEDPVTGEAIARQTTSFSIP